MNMMGHPGKKLSFMGTEFAQFDEWNFADSLGWQLLDYDMHRMSEKYSAALNRIYLENSPLWEIEDGWDGYEWLVADDNRQNVIAYERRDRKGNRIVIVINFSLSQWNDYRIGVEKGTFKRLLCTDVYGFKEGGASVKAEKVSSHGKEYSISLDIAPMSGYMFAVAAKTPKPTAKKTTAADGKIKRPAPKKTAKTK